MKISASISSSSSWSTMIHLHHYTLPRTPTTLLAAALSSSTKTSPTLTTNKLFISTKHPSWSFISFGGAFSASPRKDHGIVSASDAASGDEIPSSQEPIAVLLEVEGVLMDVYRWVNREAFNLAFQKLGLDCANWTEPIYMDLVRKAFGDEKRMLTLFFNRIGWPTSLPTNEKETFMKSVMREKRNALDEFVMTKSLPLRAGVEDFIDDALGGGIPVVILTAYSNNEDGITRSIIEKLGSERISRIKIVGKAEVEGSFYGQLVLRKSGSSGLDEQLAKEVSKAAAAEKHKIAEEVASMLNVTVEIGSGTAERVEKIVATLRAGAEYAGVPVQHCVLIAGSRSGLLGAERVGMPCVVLRSSSTSRTEYPSANAVMDDFGGAGLTISKLRQKIWP